MGKTFRRRDDYDDDDFDYKTKKMQDRRGERRKKQNERDALVMDTKDGFEDDDK